MEFRSQAPGLAVVRGAEFVCAFGGPTQVRPMVPASRGRCAAKPATARIQGESRVGQMAPR